MSLRLFLVSLVSLLIGGAVALTVLTGPSRQSVVTGKAAIGGAFALTDHTGRRVTEKDFAGKPMLVYFGFTHCPDICPSGLQVISAALDKLGPDAEKVTPLFITVDPERDTAAALAEYVTSFHPRIVGLTGTPDEIKDAAKAYRVYYKKVEDPGSAGQYTVDHTSFMYLMDKNGEFAQHFPHSVAIDTLAGAIAKQL